MDSRPLGKTDIRVSAVAMGCWPIAGMTSVNVNDHESLATLDAAMEAGVNFFDTAYCYGEHGESEKLIARAIAGCRDKIVLATKCGIHWDAGGQRVPDASPERIKWECEESLLRLNTDRVELLYLHAPDSTVPIAESAGALQELLEQGKTRAVGVSNVNLQQIKEFHQRCPLAAYQPPYNMLQRQIEREMLPWCRKNSVSVMVYWPLMKGLLAGKLAREHHFDSRDGRAKYPMFQGQEWQKNQDFLQQLRPICEKIGKTVSQVVINWTIHQPGITAALCGAKRPYQIQENAGAMGWRLSESQLARIDEALKERGEPVSGRAV